MASGIPGNPPPVPTSSMEASGIERLNFGYAEGMKNVIYIKVLNILSGDDIDLFIPLTVEREKFLKLVFLSVR
jgi:hypothetical protein